MTAAGCEPYGWWVSHVTCRRIMSHVNESCHISTSHVAVEGVRYAMAEAGCEPYEIWMSHVTCQWVMSPVNESCCYSVCVCVCIYTSMYVRDAVAEAGRKAEAVVVLASRRNVTRLSTATYYVNVFYITCYVTWRMCRDYATERIPYLL